MDLAETRRMPLIGKAKEARNLVVGLDIGTSKVVVVVAEIRPEGGYEVLAVCSQPSRGLKKGMVVNIESTVEAIQQAVSEAELMADCRIREVTAGIAGSHIRSFNSQGMVVVRDREVSQVDVDSVIRTAKAVSIPTDQQILHVLNQEFIIDGQEDVREPLGMSGVRLEVKVHIVTGAVSAAQNILRCVRRCGLEVRDLVLQPLASAAAVLSDDERDLGVVLLDIGGGTADLAVFRHGAIRHTAVIPIAGDQITSDIAMALRTPTKDAEEIKRRYGCALRQLADPSEMIEVPGVGERPPRQLSRQTLAEVIEPRAEEIYTLVLEELRRSGNDEGLSSGIVITGGSASMPGMVELGEEVFHLPVRMGVPDYAGPLSELLRGPRCATGAGLLRMAYEEQMRREQARLAGGSVQQLVARMRAWFEANF